MPAATAAWMPARFEDWYRPCARCVPRFPAHGSRAIGTGSRWESRSAAPSRVRVSRGRLLLVTQCTRSGHTAMPPFSPARA